MQTQVPGSYAGPQGRPAEPKQEMYLRQIRNILGVFLAIALISIAAGVIAGISIASHSGQQGSSSNCLSQGGTDPSC